MGRYNEDLVRAGILLAGEGLKPSAAGVRIRFSGTSRTVSDGPFTQTSELVAGLRSTVNDFSSNFFKVISSVFGGILSFVLIIVLSFYLAVQEGGIEVFLRIVTPMRHEAYVINLWERAQFKIGKWLQGQLLPMGSPNH